MHIKFILILIFVSLLFSCNQTGSLTVDELRFDQLFAEQGIKIVDNKTVEVLRKGSNAVLRHTVKNGRFDGVCTGYYPSGELELKGFYKKGIIDGKWMKWYQNGNIAFEINYSKGNLNGPYITFYEDGIIKEEGAYLNNTKSGIWKIYNSKGKMIKSVNYDTSDISSL